MEKVTYVLESAAVVVFQEATGLLLNNDTNQ